MRKIALFVLISSLPLLAACAGNDNDFKADEGQPAASFGDAVKRDMAVQIVNPEAGHEPLTMEGQRAALAQDRYVKGKVIKPADINSSGNGNGGGNSGNNSGGGSSSSGGMASQ
jgi:uncharacterized membrane protein YgcG